MTGASIEAAGDLASGALLARAVERGTGSLGHTSEGSCLSCGTGLVGRYCHHCGQSAHVHSTLASVAHDLLHGAFHFEGKIWRTLPMLALRPGQLTWRYIAGDRARFVSPLAAFLFSVFLMFAAFEAFGPPLHPRISVERNGRAYDAGQLHAAMVEAGQEITRLEAARRVALATGKSTIAIDGQLARARANADDLATAKQLAEGAANPAALARAPLRTGWAGLDRRVAEARANPALILFQLQANAHKFAWALIPISVPFVWLMFAWRRGTRVYDHTVFVTYSLSTVMLLLVLMALLGALGLKADLALGLVPVHFFLQLRGAYALGWWGALWRTGGLIVASFLSLVLFALLMIVIGLAG